MPVASSSPNPLLNHLGRSQIRRLSDLTWDEFKAEVTYPTLVANSGGDVAMDDSSDVGKRTLLQRFDGAAKRRTVVLVLPIQQRTSAACSTLLVGRGSHCDVTLPFPQVSSIHFTLNQVDGKYFLMDANSKNGTSVNDVDAPPEVSVELKDRSLITVGDLDMDFLLPRSFFEHLCDGLPRRDRRQAIKIFRK